MKRCRLTSASDADDGAPEWLPEGLRAAAGLPLPARGERVGVRVGVRGRFASLSLAAGGSRIERK
jgi:hypothetical protein